MKTRFAFIAVSVCASAAFAHAAPMFQHPFLELPPRIHTDYARFALVSPPNPELKIGVLAIVPNRESTSPRSAAALAEFVARQYSNGKWIRREIYVFADRQSAQVFARYQAPRRSKTLSAQDFQNLRAIWPKTLVFLAKEEERTRILYPSRNPNMWWQKIS